MNILILNGPNLNLLGSREVSHYGSLPLSGIEEMLRSEFPHLNLEFKQSNLEGDLINFIHSAVTQTDGLIINPGGYAHTSVAIHDALQSLNIPKIEVHLSNIAARDDFRKIHLTASACNGYISGFKQYSYSAALYLLQKLITERK